MAGESGLCAGTDTAWCAGSTELLTAEVAAGLDSKNI